MSVTVKKKYLSTHVTSIKFVGAHIFAGVGGNLNVINIKTQGNQTELKKVIEIFENQNIYGIKPRSEKELLIYGGRNVAVLKYDILSLDFEVSKRIIIDDWILDCIWLDSSSVAALTMNNSVSKINLNSGLYEKVSCEMRCILYSGVVLNKEWENLVILAGTVFQEVVIWSVQNKSPIHTLKGHKGVIFSVKYDSLTNRICTTSDDRTVRFWSVKFSDQNNWSDCEIVLQHTIFAHMARVWDCLFLSNSWVISIGEDSLISIWNNIGKCENQWYGHQGGSIWSVDCCEKLKVIATGGSDGGIDLWPLASKSKPIYLPFDISEQRTPKSLVLNRRSKILLSTNLGEIWTFTENRWVLSYFNIIFKNYSLLCISPDRLHVSLAGINGHIFVFKADDVKLCVESKAIEGRIFSLNWLSSSLFATSGINGQISLWTFNSEKNILEILETFTLPECKERWITCSCVSGEFFLCGDRNGSIHLFLRSKNKQRPISTLKREHGPRGVSDLKNLTDQIFSIGRDGTYKQIRIENEKLAVSSTYKLPMEWPAVFRHTEAFGNVILGFYEIRFIVWSLDERRILLSVDCGGGHRSWDCHFNDTIDFSYIKEKSIAYFSEELSKISLGAALTGSHSKTINSCCLINSEKGCFFVSGSEDTTLKLFSASDTLLPIGTYRTHISSVKSVCSLNSENILFVASGGGRGQLILWRLITTEKNPSLIELAESILRVENKPSEQEPLDEPEIRYMDLSMLINNKQINIFAGCSDGVVRCHLFDTSNGKLTIGICIKNDFCCILKLATIRDVLTCSYTDGKVSMWKIDDSMEINRSLKLHSLGINSCDLIESEGSYILATGSDDSSIALNAMDKNFNILCAYNHKNLHNCQISGIRINERFLITGGMDQKICLLSWSFSDSVIKANLISEVKTCIPDVHGILIKSEKDVITVYLYGIGVQIVNLAIS